MKTILILDDEGTIRNCLCLMLSKLLPGCIVLEASDGKRGMEILKQRKVDLIVTDLNMPELNGFGVLELAKREFPAILVYIMTGYCDYRDRELLRGLGMNRFFEKPFSFASMAETASADLGLKPADRQESEERQGVYAAVAR